MVKDLIEVYFYVEGNEGWHLHDSYHTITKSDIARKISATKHIQKSRTLWTYKFEYI